jgi:hypothetical protein
MNMLKPSLLPILSYLCENNRMLRALITIIGIVAVCYYVQLDYKPKVPYKKYWPYVAAAFAIQFASGVAFSIVGGPKGNLIYHAVGGGVMSTLFFIYLVKTFGFTFSRRIELGALFLFVSGLGVLNELAEYAAELSGHGLFSWDTHDTWRDLAANTCGALTAWLLYLLVTTVLKKSRPNRQ